MPALFIGHGSPMNALVTNKWTEDWKALGASLPRPRAIVAISAHWYTDGTGVTAVSTPRTIHDFGGFPRALFEVQYPAPGDPDLAKDLTEILAPTPVLLDSYWGLDHGTWSVLVRMFPKADIPVVQLSIDGTAPPETHRALGERLASLRDKGVLLVGSGNVVHNLRAGFGDQAPEYDWAKRFDEKVRELTVSGDAEQLASYEQLGPDAELCVPTPDHYYPLLYTVGARREGDAVTFPTEGLNGGVSVLAVKWMLNTSCAPAALQICARAEFPSVVLLSLRVSVTLYRVASSSARTRCAMSRLSSFSTSPPAVAPGSVPPWPGSRHARYRLSAPATGTLVRRTSASATTALRRPCLRRSETRINEV